MEVGGWTALRVVCTIIQFCFLHKKRLLGRREQRARGSAKPGWISPVSTRLHEAGRGNRGVRARSAEGRDQPDGAAPPAGGRGRAGRWLRTMLLLVAVRGGLGGDRVTRREELGARAGAALRVAGWRTEWQGGAPSGPGQAGGRGAAPGRLAEGGNWTGDVTGKRGWGLMMAGGGTSGTGQGTSTMSESDALREALGMGGVGEKRRRAGDGGDGGDGKRDAGTLDGMGQGRTVLRRGFAEHFLVYSANVGGSIAARMPRHPTYYS